MDVFLSRVPQTGAHFSAPSLVTHSDLHRVTQTVWERVAGFAFGKPGRPPPSVWPSDWSAGSQTTSSGAVTVMLLLRREGGKGPLFCSSCCWILIWAVRKGKDRKEKSDDASWEWEKGAKKQEESKVWGKGWRKLERNQGGNDVTGKERRKW